jgi:hypothetical protein
VFEQSQRKTGYPMALRVRKQKRFKSQTVYRYDSINSSTELERMIDASPRVSQVPFGGMTSSAAPE